MQGIVTSAIVVGVAAVLALPAVVAILRKHPSWVSITFLAAALGWTGLGWIAALWWALRPTQVRRRRAKVRRIKSPRARAVRHAAPATVPRHDGANDNASTRRRSDVEDILPGFTASDPYADWLEQGEALRESDSAIEAAGKDDARMAGGLAA